MSDNLIPKDKAMKMAKKLILSTTPDEEIELKIAIKLCDEPKEIIPFLRDIKGMCTDLIKSLKAKENEENRN